MSVIYIDVIQEPALVTNAVIYTAPKVASFESAHVIFANCTNNGNTDSDLTINIVQQGGAASSTNQYFPAKTIFSGQTDPLTPIVGVGLKAGDFISTISQLANNLNVKMTIKEIYTSA